MELSSDNLKEIRKKDNCIIFEYNSKEDAWLAYEQGFKRYAYRGVKYEYKQKEMS